MKIFLYTLSIILLTACSSRPVSPPVAPVEKQIVDISDLFQTGHSRFQAVMDRDSTLNEVWMNRREDVVMVLIDIRWDDGDREQAQQSGIIVNDGEFILTAGHGFAIEDGEVTQTRVRTSSNNEAIVNVRSLVYDKQKSSVEDWAILQPMHKLNHKSSGSPSSGTINRSVLVLGYPGSLGVTNDGLVVRVQESLLGQKYPLGMVCDRERLDKHTLFPLAGSVPIRGISGAPVFNAQGELIGLFSSMGRRRNILGWQYVFWMSDIPWETINKL